MLPARVLLAVVVLGSMAAWSGCAPGSDVDEDEDAEVGDEAIYADSAHLWASNTIRVCWENPTDSDVAGRGWVQDAVATSWESVSPIDFTGWEKCGSSDGGSIRIVIQDDGPKVQELGSKLAGRKNGMLLNFTFNNWSPDCKNSLEYCIRTIAVHEFGHALGFAHEQNRPDTDKSWCDQEQGSDGDVVIGTWDLDSVMNYCNPAWSGHGQLSEKDILGVQMLYGGPGLGGFIVNAQSDKCADVGGGSYEPGAPVLSYSCHGDANQRWNRTDAGDGYTWIHARHSGQCLAVEGGSKDYGAKIVQVACDHDDAHKWRVPSSSKGTLINKGSGLCLDLDGANAADGVQLIQWGCNGGNNQRFTLY